MKQVKPLATIFLKQKSELEMCEFLEGILTPQEIIDLNKRYEIVKRLKAGQTQRQIAKDLQVGIATVTRGSRELSKGRFRNV